MSATFEEFKREAMTGRPECFRKGQHAFNTLTYHRPKMCGKVVDTPADPYYVDANLPAFFEYVQQHWDDPS